jgi:hypothetical protein
MQGPKRTKVQRDRDRAEIARLYLTGALQIDIGARLGLSQQQISYDLKAIRKEWLQSSLRDFDEARSQELAKIDHLETTYWDAWRRSVEKREIETSKMVETAGGQRMEAATRTELQAGDPRFLAGVQWCIDRRCKLLGLDAPDRIEHAGQISLIDVLQDLRQDNDGPMADDSTEE